MARQQLNAPRPMRHHWSGEFRDVSSAEDTVSIPDDALVFRHSDTYVSVVRNNLIQLARVALGIDDGPR
jgi:hypothetical protein